MKMVNLQKAIRLSIASKAESLLINSIGQRPMEQSIHVNPKPQRGVINFIANY
jgi:hypothetical protein